MPPTENPLVALDLRSAQRTKAVVEAFELMPKPGGYRQGQGLNTWLIPAKIGVTMSSGVSARSGSTPGSGQVTLYTLTSGALTATSKTVTAYNLSSTAVAGSAYVGLVWASGVWWVMWEDCG